MSNETAASEGPSARGRAARTALLLTVLLLGGNAALAQRAGSIPSGAQRITESLLDRSLPGLVAEGWQVAAVSQSGPAFAYHLVRDGSLAVCYVSLADQPLNSLCYRLVGVP